MKTIMKGWFFAKGLTKLLQQFCKLNSLINPSVPVMVFVTWSKDHNYCSSTIVSRTSTISLTFKTFTVLPFIAFTHYIVGVSQCFVILAKLFVFLFFAFMKMKKWLIIYYEPYNCIKYEWHILFKAVFTSFDYIHENISTLQHLNGSSFVKRCIGQFKGINSFRYILVKV